MTIYKDEPTLENYDDDAWIDPNSQNFYLCIGERGFGKGVFDEFVANELYDSGITIIDLHGADNLENFFWCVNLNHGKEHDAWKTEHPNEREPLECECSQAYPILIICPNYVEWDQKSLDFANGKYYTREQWENKMRDGETLEPYDKTNPPEKPIELQPEPLIVVKHVPLPMKSRNAKNAEFIEAFTSALLQARKERRILCVNPKMWLPEHESYHFKSLEIILRQIRHIAYEHFQPLTEEALGRKKKDWTVQELSWHRTAIIIREASEILPQGTKGDFSGDSLLSKKGMMGLVKKSRHESVNLILDTQRYSDIFPPVRDEHSILVLKHTPDKLQGEELKKYEDKIDLKREAILEKFNYNKKGFKKANKRYPNIKKMGYNYAYIIKSDDVPRLETIPMPKFHHKLPTDNWCNLMQVYYTINKDLIKVTQESKIDATNLKPNESQEKILYHTIKDLKDEKKFKWDIVLEKLIELQEHSVLHYPKLIKDMTNASIRKKYSDMRKKILGEIPA